MMQTHFTRAKGVTDTLIIVIDSDEFAEIDVGDSGWEKSNREFFRGEARRLVDHLQKSLPGGTMDHLFAELALRRASVFHVPNDKGVSRSGTQV